MTQPTTVLEPAPGGGGAPASPQLLRYAFMKLARDLDARFESCCSPAGSPSGTARWATRRRPCRPASPSNAGDALCTLHRDLGAILRRLPRPRPHLPRPRLRRARRPRAPSRVELLYRLACQLLGKDAGFSRGVERSFHYGYLAPEAGILHVGMISHLGSMIPVAAGCAFALARRRRRAASRSTSSATAAPRPATSTRGSTWRRCGSCRWCWWSRTTATPSRPRPASSTPARGSPTAAPATASPPRPSTATSPTPWPRPRPRRRPRPGRRRADAARGDARPHARPQRGGRLAQGGATRGAGGVPRRRSGAGLRPAPGGRRGCWRPSCAQRLDVAGSTAWSKRRWSRRCGAAAGSRDGLRPAFAPVRDGGPARRDAASGATAGRAGREASVAAAPETAAMAAFAPDAASAVQHVSGAAAAARRRPPPTSTPSTSALARGDGARPGASSSWARTSAPSRAPSASPAASSPAGPTASSTPRSPRAAPSASPSAPPSSASARWSRCSSPTSSPAASTSSSTSPPSSTTAWQVPCPLVVRLPSGGGVGAGPFHSQNPEGWFAHVAGLKVVCPATASRRLRPAQGRHPRPQPGALLRAQVPLPADQGGVGRASRRCMASRSWAAPGSARRGRPHPDRLRRLHLDLPRRRRRARQGGRRGRGRRPPHPGPLRRGDGPRLGRKDRPRPGRPRRPAHRRLRRRGRRPPRRRRLPLARRPGPPRRLPRPPVPYAKNLEAQLLPDRDKVLAAARELLAY